MLQTCSPESFSLCQFRSPAEALEEDWKKTKGAGCVGFVTKNFSTVAQVEGMLANMKEWSRARAFFVETGLSDVVFVGAW